MEGADLVVAGLAAGYRPQMVFVRAERAQELNAALGLPAGAAGGVSPTARPAAGPGASAPPPPAVYPVNERVAARLSTLESPPDVLAVFPLPPRRPLSELRGLADAAADIAGAGPAASPLVVYADGIADPGNMGTLLRAAVAFGAAALATAPGSTDLYGPKTVRASMGAIFGLPLLHDVELGVLVEQLHVAHVYGLAAHGGVPLAEVGLECPAVLVVGGERPGLSQQALAHITQLVTIPLAPRVAGFVESLNAGVAGAIALYELTRHTTATSAPTAPPAGADH